ncbi:carbohydrate ABC transporter permease [Natronorubrum aibiense]|uniref:ABC transporter permease subunit n=1 Tax=Natronorubrum aibiense TaxID=348826 RepID=A0A5P9P9F5_9EURY|nr:carbohydrate ABC transporter permease [Natronorubrum aibiense]QFU84779.1 ABC transporter permease subunit [Natronorubrum aibiense]
MSTRTIPLVGNRKNTGETLKMAGLYAFLYGTAFLFLLPYIWMMSTSLKTEQHVFSQVPQWIPPEITFEWYIAVLTGAPMIQWFLNTLLIAGATTVIVVVLNSMIAFSLTKLEWPGKRIVFGVIIASFMVPVFANMVPLFALISRLGLVNNPLAVILPFSAMPIGVFLLVQFFRDLPDEIIEAARLDGFSTFQIYYRIVLPLMKPAIAALSLYTFVYTWNQFLWPLIVLQQETAFTLPVGIVAMQPTQVFQPGAEMAGTLLAVLPLFIVFLILQEHLVNAVQAQGTVG